MKHTNNNNTGLSLKHNDDDDDNDNNNKQIINKIKDKNQPPHGYPCSSSSYLPPSAAPTVP